MHTVVLGIGNTLQKDDGIGVHVTNYMRRQLGLLPGVSFIDGGTLSFTLAHLIDDATALVVVDATELHHTPGTMSIFLEAEMDRMLYNKKHSSVHELNLMDLLDIMRITGRLPAHRALVAIQPGEIDWGEKPTAAVCAAIPNASEEILLLLREWQACAA